MDGGNGGDLTGLDRRFLSNAQRAADEFEGVADVLELAVEFVAVAMEEVLQTLEQVRREVGRVTDPGPDATTSKLHAYGARWLDIPGRAVRRASRPQALAR